ncbi:uncharacterized protein TNCV_1734391 [Trichonephila clavipes]|nr:uncharacterized protein TNCV_1734391 [Trichonephila clavipes]
MRSACDQSTLPIDVQVFHCKARDPHVEAWRVGCHLSRPPRHSTEVTNHTVYERRVRYTVSNSVYTILGPEVHEQMFRSGGQSDAKSQVLSSQENLVLIYGPTEDMSAESTFPSPKSQPRTCGVEAHCTNHSVSGLLKIKY